MPGIEEMINIGFTHHQNGKLDDAEMAYNEALKLDSSNAEVYNLLGVLKLQQGDIDCAESFVEKAIEISPNAYFYETLFQTYIRAKKYVQNYIIRRSYK